MTGFQPPDSTALESAIMDVSGAFAALDSIMADFLDAVGMGTTMTNTQFGAAYAVLRLVKADLAKLSFAFYGHDVDADASK